MVARVLSSYGDFVEGKINDLPRAELLYKEALEIRRRQSALTSGKVIFGVDASLYDLAWLCKRQKRYDEAEQYGLEAVEIRRRLFVQNPMKYQTSLQRALELLKLIYEAMKRPELADKMDSEIKSLLGLSVEVD